ncbi:hypothetical protein RCS94_03975 [Orbaceae bacterium ac157xtp]
MIVPSSYGALSATSANTIQGRAPVIQSNRLGFKVNGASYSQAIGNIDPSVAKAFDAGLSFSHFKIMDLTSADYYDADGDVAHSTTPFTTGTKSIKWYDSNDTEITDMTKTLGCGNNYSLPLKLRIEIQGVEVHSKYGDPRDSSPTTLTKEYLISTASGICYVKPGSLQWWDSNGGYTSSLRDPTTGGGYTSDFDPNKGFKAQPTESRDKFPTTGFPYARFQIIMSGSPTDYNYTVTSHPLSVVKIDKNGWVTLKTKPTDAVTVRATSKASSSIYFDYTFNPTKLWLVPKLNSPSASAGYGWYTDEEAKTVCGDESKMPTRAQLTNSPQSTVLPANLVDPNYFTRAIGKLVIGGNVVNESILGEWGNVYDNANLYPSSKWSGTAYWTSESYSSVYQFRVKLNTGSVGYFSGKSWVACLG